MAPSNRAAWQETAKARYTVADAPSYTAGPNEVLVRNHAVAINPVEWKVQDYDPWGFQYPKIAGCDVAGIVLEVGEGVTHVKAGDRVLGHAIGLITTRPQDGAFQHTTVVPSTLCAPIPANVPFTAAAVLPLGTSTAAHGLFSASHLGLRLPTTAAQNGSGATKETLLVWGGASSVGSCAIQLAVAAGYTVLTTASAKNFQYCRDLGASGVFDYASPSVVADLVEALQGSKCVGAYDAISEKGTSQLAAQVLAKVEGSVKVMATVLPGAEGEHEGGVKAVHCFAPAIKDGGVGEAVYQNFLPEALKDGRMKAKPEAKVVGEGLEVCQKAVDMSREGVSAAKLVVILEQGE